jgi:hypothetical protein
VPWNNEASSGTAGPFAVADEYDGVTVEIQDDSDVTMFLAAGYLIDGNICDTLQRRDGRIASSGTSSG